MACRRFTTAGPMLATALPSTSRPTSPAVAATGQSLAKSQPPINPSRPLPGTRMGFRTPCGAWVSATSIAAAVYRAEQQSKCSVTDDELSGAELRAICFVQRSWRRRTAILYRWAASSTVADCPPSAVVALHCLPGTSLLTPRLPSVFPRPYEACSAILAFVEAHGLFDAVYMQEGDDESTDGESTDASSSADADGAVFAWPCHGFQRPALN